jgi:hypothetical protein
MLSESLAMKRNAKSLHFPGKTAPSEACKYVTKTPFFAMKETQNLCAFPKKRKTCAK